MRFASTLSTIIGILSVSSSISATPILGNTFEETTLTRAYKRLVSANICATVNPYVTLPARVCTKVVQGGTITNPTFTTVDAGVQLGLTPAAGVTCSDVGGGVNANLVLATNVCLCLQDGLLTQDSINNLNAAISSTGTQALLGVNGSTAGLVTLLGGGTNLLNLANLLTATEVNVLPQVGNQATNCVYGTDAIPSCPTSSTGDQCPFTCPTTSPKKCNRSCIGANDACTSSIPRRRDQVSMSPHDWCPGTLMACGVPGAQAFSGHNYECVDTFNDIESCGACATPLPGQPMGKDCTAIPFAAGVACVQGSCVVNACARGFELGEDKISCVLEGSAKKIKARAAITKRQVRVAELKARKPTANKNTWSAKRR